MKSTGLAGRTTGPGYARMAWMGFACALLLIAMAKVGVSNAYASSGFGIERYSLDAIEESGSIDTQPGSHPYQLTAEAMLDPNTSNASENEVRNLNFELPPGLIIDPRAVPQYSLVGEVQMSVGGRLMSAPLYNLAPALGEFGRLGFTFNDIQMFVNIAIDTGSDYGMDVGGYGITMSIHNIPELGHDVESVELILDSTSSLLVTLPTSCSVLLQTTIQDESWSAQTASLSIPFQQMTGCGKLLFEPALSVASDVLEASEPSGYTLRLTTPQNEGPIVASQLKNASVSLPEGVSLSLSATNGLSGCAEARFALGSSARENCPESSKVGLVTLRTPLLAEPLKGVIFLATQNSNPFGGLITLYAEAEDQVSGVRLKLVGDMTLNQSTGQATLTFDGLPQLPIGEIEVQLFGGERSLLSNPPVCGVATAVGEMMSWGGDTEEEVNSSFDLSEGANGGPCISPTPFDPQIRLEPTAVSAGASGTFALSVSRTSAEQDLSRFSARMPAGLTWMFGNVPLCGEPSAGEGTCPPATQVGTAVFGVGPISGLVPFTGQIYLTEGYGGGQYGLSIVLNAVAGPFDLGEIVVRAAIASDPSTGALTIMSDRLPQIVDGVPLQTNALEIKLERPGLVLNPAVCESQQIGATIESVEGAILQTSNPFNVEGCQNQSSTPVVPGGSAKVMDAGSRAALGPVISHIHYRFSDGRLLLTFKIATNGTVTITGSGVRRYVRQLRAGTHNVRLVLSKVGRFEMRHHRRFEFTLALRAAGSVSTAERAFEPLGISSK